MSSQTHTRSALAVLFLRLTVFHGMCGAVRMRSCINLIMLANQMTLSADMNDRRLVGIECAKDFDRSPGVLCVFMAGGIKQGVARFRSKCACIFCIPATAASYPSAAYWRQLWQLRKLLRHDQQQQVMVSRQFTTWPQGRP